MGHGAGAETAQTRLARLHSMAGGPSFADLEAAAARVGVRLSKSTVHNLLHGKGQPRWETVKAFVVACEHHAALSRPPMPIPPEERDLSRWSDWYRRLKNDDRDVHVLLNRSRKRFEEAPRNGGGYQHMLTPEFAAAARMGKACLADLSDQERAYLLTATLFLGMGDGFGLYEFLPDADASWSAGSCAPLLASQAYRTGRYRAAMVLQHMTFADRDEIAERALSQSNLRTWRQLLQAIRDVTVGRFVDDPLLCYDYGTEEAHKRRALVSTAVGITEIYHRRRAARQHH